MITELKKFDTNSALAGFCVGTIVGSVVMLSHLYLQNKDVPVKTTAKA